MQAELSALDQLMEVLETGADAAADVDQSMVPWRPLTFEHHPGTGPFKTWHNQFLLTHGRQRNGLDLPG